jgi:hypothetical protein
MALRADGEAGHQLVQAVVVEELDGVQFEGSPAFDESRHHTLRVVTVPPPRWTGKPEGDQ